MNYLKRLKLGGDLSSYYRVNCKLVSTDCYVMTDDTAYSGNNSLGLGHTYPSILLYPVQSSPVQCSQCVQTGPIKGQVFFTNIFFQVCNLDATF